MTNLKILAASIVFASPLSAEIQIEFKEGAPKDRFVISNLGDCDYKNVSMQVDLSNSAGKLIFDTTNQGAGVEVFQPFEIVSGQEWIIDTDTPSDGDQSFALEIAALPSGADLILSTDVDDTIAAREITVRGSEFNGSTAAVTIDGRTETVEFGDTPIARLQPSNC